MFSKRDIIIFCAGAAAFHTLSHIGLSLFATLPMEFSFITLTPVLNFWAILISAGITGTLLWWASTLKK
jgi:hypothetical protein